MRSTTVRQFTVGLAAIATITSGLVPAAWAQSPKNVVRGLEENQNLIRECRQVNQTVAVFSNINLGPLANRLGTLMAGQRVILTGVVSLGRAQIFIENEFDRLGPAQPVGWINAGFLSLCGSPIPAVNRACFRADAELRVRPTRSSTDNVITTYKMGDVFFASTNPPLQISSNNLSWLEVIMNDGTFGWVVETISGQRNATQINCP